MAAPPMIGGEGSGAYAFYSGSRPLFEEHRATSPPRRHRVRGRGPGLRRPARRRAAQRHDGDDGGGRARVRARPRRGRPAAGLRPHAQRLARRHVRPRPARPSAGHAPHLGADVPLPAGAATTRLAEHWAHAQDITVPLGLAYPDTDRLRHIAWLAHRTLPYAFSVAGRPDAAVFCDLTAPDGTHWTFGDAAAPNRITGPAAQFCRVGARRLAPEQTDLTAEGPQAAEALRLVRNYAA